MNDNNVRIQVGSSSKRSFRPSSRIACKTKIFRSQDHTQRKDSEFDSVPTSLRGVPNINRSGDAGDSGQKEVKKKSSQN